MRSEDPREPRPLVTIVTPSLDQAGFIAAAIDSVLAQDYPRIEYLVMDGGSSDGTLDVLRRYGERVRWRSCRDAGQVDAILRGFDDAQGSILAWLNADDRYLPGAVSRAVAHLQAHPDDALVYGHAEFIDGEGRVLGPCDHVEPFSAERLLRVHDFIAQPTAFFRRRAFAAVGGLDPWLDYCFDYDLWLKLSTHGGVGFLRQPQAQVRIHPASKTAQAGIERFLELERMMKRHGRSRLPEAFYAAGFRAYLARAADALRERKLGTATGRFGRAILYGAAHGLRRITGRAS